MDSEDSCLYCKEDESSLKQQFEELDFFCSVSECDSEYIEMLIQKESIFQSNFSAKTQTNWLKCARLDAIKWILDTRVILGLHIRTAYLSLIYFDGFISRRWIDDGKLWAVRLLSVACLSLAAKMEECEAPALSEYHVDEFSFEGNVIQRMELLVLNALGWKMSCVTPFDYLDYFIIKLGGEIRRNDVMNRAVELILAVIGEMNSIEYRSSVIAAAAVLAACDYHLTEKLVEIKMNAIPSWGLLEKEHVYSCYTLLQEIGMSKSKKSKLIIPHNLSSTQSSSIDDLDDSTITSTVGKKRVLTYIDDDHYCPQNKIPKSY